MKKGIRIAIIVSAVLFFAMPVWNLIRSPVSLPIETSDPNFEPVAKILQSSCADCHASELASRPLYAYLPIASGMVDEDIAAAEARWRLTQEQLTGASPLPARVVAKLAGVVRDDNMPPSRYLTLHWNAGLSDEDRDAITTWAKGRWAARPEAAVMAEALRGEPVQPVVMPSDLNPGKVALGDSLYHDQRLSGDGTLSCASCHGLEMGGTDLAPVSTGINGQKGPINAPTVFNSSYNVAQFWDGRARDLQDQAGGPVENPLEMGAKFSDVIEVLKKDPNTVAEFAKVFPKRGISKESITEAIAHFEESLVTPDSPFDLYLKGQSDAVSKEALEGYTLFKDKGCVDCHFGPALGGESFEELGRRRDYFADRSAPKTDVDLGRFNHTGEERDRHHFKVPVLRNINRTAPYFHDASAKTLEEAVIAMARYQLDWDPSSDETAKLVAFLNSLTGLYKGAPVK